jgi:collagen triple helix repeat protein
MVRDVLRRRGRLTYLLRVVGAAGVIALVFGAGSVFGALGNAQPTTYYGCLQVGGLLSNVGTTPPRNCGPTGRLISWGAEGPSGATGPSGPSGATGASGPSGPAGPSGTSGASGLSHAYVVRTTSTAYVTESIPVSAQVAVAELTGLPAGVYAVTATENAALPVTTDFQFPVPGGEITCELSPGGANSRQGVVVQGIAGVTMDDLSVTVPDVVTITEGESITLTCSGPVGTTSNNAVITAIAVDAVN